MATVLNGQFDLSSAKEDVALASSTDVASFTVNNNTDTASDFSASIDWGDGTTTPGTIAGSNGHFTVEGSHTYSDEGFPFATVNVTRPADNSQLAITGTVPVADTDTINPHGTTITFTPNTPLTNVTVATFTDPTNNTTPASDFIAQIDWGDGNTTTGTIVGSAGSFSVVGSHTYTTAGESIVSVSIADNFPDAATGFVTSTAVSGFGGQVTLTSATEGTPLTSTEVATFVDTTGSHVAGDYTASIQWGDGTTDTGTVGGSGQSFTVTGSHTYADEEVNGDSPVMKVVVTRTADTATATATGTIEVTDADFLTMHSQSVGGSANQALSSVTIATFNDAYTGQVASDLQATIDWGDGSAVAVGTLSGSTGSFTVKGSHTYTADGHYNVNVNILDDLPSGEAVIGSTISTANIGLSAGDFLLDNVIEGDVTAHNVATFNDGVTTDLASDFTAAIDWGDGTTTSGTISGASGSFTVSGVHAYADEATETPVVTVTRTADQATVTIAGDTTVGEGDSITLTPDNINGNPGIALNNVQVATFNTSFAGSVASGFIADIDWGDGTTSAGTIAGGSGNFTVTGAHTYTSGGNDTLHVTVTDTPPGTATITGTATATINFAGQVVLTSATEHVAVPNGTPVATFSDSNGGDTPASFTAAIDWGDGTTSSGTISGGAGTFTVSGGHTYADEGNDTAKVTLTHTADGAASTVSGSVAVAENDALTPHATTFTAAAGTPFSGTVATFTDTDTVSPAGDFSATINWGDGVTTAGTVSGSNGSFAVSGTHTYGTSGQKTLSVTLADDAPGTAVATAQSTANVDAPPVVTGSVTLPSISEDSNAVLITQAQLLGNVTDPDGPSLTAINLAIATGQGTLVDNHNGTWSYTPAANDGSSASFSYQVTDGVAAPVADTANMDITQPHWSASSDLGTHPAGSNPATIGDFVQDGTSDILWENPATFGVDVWKIVNGQWGGTVLITAHPAGYQIAPAGDYNGDGISDVLWYNPTNGDVDLWKIFNGQWGGSVHVGTHPLGALPVASGDFNHDGVSDILWFNPSTNGVDIWKLSNTGQWAGSTDLGSHPAGSQVVGAGDFNGDGTSDVLWYNPTTRDAEIWKISNGQWAGSVDLGTHPAGYTPVGIGDFNADGTSDILWFNATTNDAEVWLIKNGQWAGSVDLGTHPAGWTPAGVGDFNHDGTSDILWRENSTGHTEIWLLGH